MKKILVFGATGETGLYVVDYLSTHLLGDYSVCAIGRRKTNYFDRYGIDYYSVDIQNKEDFEILPKDDVYAIINLAAILPARMEKYEPEKYLEINTIGTFNVLEYSRKVSAKKFVFTKSVSDYYGYLTGNDVFAADLPVKYNYKGDHTIYAISKCAAADIAEHYHQSFGISTFILRLPNIYCYNPEKYYYVNGEKKPISYRYMIDRAIASKDIELWGNPEKGRDVVYVKDFAQIIYKVILSECDGGTFNVGSGKLTNMVDQIQGIIEVFSPKDNPSKIIYCPEKRDCINYLMDISKTKEILGYEPQYNYIDYLKDYKSEMNSDRFEGL